MNEVMVKKAANLLWVVKVALKPDDNERFK